MILLQMGEDSELYIHLGSGNALSQQWVAAQQLQEHLSSAKIEELSHDAKNWLYLRWGKGLREDIKCFDCIYPLLEPRFGAIDYYHSSDI